MEFIDKIKNNLTKENFSFVSELIDFETLSQIKKTIEDLVKDDKEVLSKFVPRAQINLQSPNLGNQYLLEITNEKNLNEFIKLFSHNSSIAGITPNISFDMLLPDSKIEKESGGGGFCESTVIKIFIGEGDLTFGNFKTTVLSGSVILYKNDFGINYSFKNNSSTSTIVITIKVKTRLVDADLIHSFDPKDNIGVIIDCKDYESPSKLKDFEYGLANFTRKNLIKNGFANIVAFSSRNDFDKSVNTLRENGINRVLVLFSGSTVGKNTKQKVKNAQHITAWKQKDVVIRKYIIFDVDKYKKFQIRGEFLSNVLEEIKSKDPEYFEILSMTANEKNYKFLENIYHGYLDEAQEIINQKKINDTEAGQKIIERMKEIMLNTV